jgi:hypothetical protein
VRYRRKSRWAGLSFSLARPIIAVAVLLALLVAFLLGLALTLAVVITNNYHGSIKESALLVDGFSRIRTRHGGGPNIIPNVRLAGGPSPHIFTEKPLTRWHPVFRGIRSSLESGKGKHAVLRRLGALKGLVSITKDS